MNDRRKAQQWTAEALRMLRGNRRPEDMPLVRQVVLDTLVYDEKLLRDRALQSPPLVSDLIPRQMSGLNRDQWAKWEANRNHLVASRLRQPDTFYAFAGYEFCDLIAATDDPPVFDVSLLNGVGNHAVMLSFARNLTTGVEGDALTAALVFMDYAASDGVPRLGGVFIHEDSSSSCFYHSGTPVGCSPGALPDLLDVDWGGGVVNRRDANLTTERHLLANALGLLAQTKAVKVTPWRHYPKGVKTAAAVHRQKLPTVNVITLQARAQLELDEHQEAAGQPRERDGWWGVRGHFKMVRWGPGRRYVRQTYVGPHRRGNLDGPNIGRFQVHQTA